MPLYCGARSDDSLIIGSAQEWCQGRRAFLIGQAGWNDEPFPGAFNTFREQVYPCSSPASSGLFLVYCIRNDPIKANLKLFSKLGGNA